MRAMILGAGLMLLASVPTQAAPPAPVVVDLWPGVAPGEKGNIPPEKLEPARPKENPPIQRLGNVSKPSIMIMKPAPEIDTGAGPAQAGREGGQAGDLAVRHRDSLPDPGRSELLPCEQRRSERQRF